MFHHFSFGGAAVIVAALVPTLAFAAPAVPAPAGTVGSERPAKDAEISDQTGAPQGSAAEAGHTVRDSRRA